MRGLDLESTRTLLDKLQRELRGLSNRTASLVDESPPAIGDELGYLSTDIAHLVAIVEVLQFREDTVLYRVQPKQKETETYDKRPSKSK